MTDPNTETQPPTAEEMAERARQRLSAIRTQFVAVYDELSASLSAHLSAEADLVKREKLADRLFDIASRIEQTARILAGEAW